MAQEWGQKAAGLRWLHLESAKFYLILSDMVTIPTIVISAGAGITALKETCGSSLSIVVGALNLLAAFFVALTRYYTPAELAGKHRAASNDFGKLYRRVALELSMPKYRRSRCFEFMLGCRTEYDRLVSTDLQPPGFVINRYKKQFKTQTHKPEVVNVGLEQVHIAHGEAPHPTQGNSTGQEGLPIVTRTLHHPHRKHRPRRASTILQDSIIDPGKAMASGVHPSPSMDVPMVVEINPMPAEPPSGIETPFANAQHKARGLLDNSSNRLPSIRDEDGHVA